MENHGHCEVDATGSLEPLKVEERERKYDHSLSYIDDPTVVFKHEKGNILLSCVSDYQSACGILHNPDNDVLPIYVPSSILGERKLDVKLIETLKKDFMDYGARVWAHGEKDIIMNSAWAVVYSEFPDISYERRLLATIFTFWFVLSDDQLEELISKGMLQSVAKPWIRNKIKIWACKNEPLIDLRRLATNETRSEIALAIKIQDILLNLIRGLQTEMPPEVFKHFCELKCKLWMHLELELEGWVEIMKSNAMPNKDNRIAIKHIASGLSTTYSVMLNSQDVQFYSIGSFFDNVVTMSTCTENDIFSYFKEHQDACFPNVFNLVDMYIAEGMDLKSGFREVVKQRNELVRAVEVELENVPEIQRKSLNKGLLAMLASTHYHFTNTRYGWIPIAKH